MAMENKKYTLRINRTIVDDLGLKLYDKISAVVAELIANSYDADAEHVVVELPIGKALATRQVGQIQQSGYMIMVTDDGHGMTPEEANEFYLDVGRHRRDYHKQGDLSRNKKRSVMGRKGIGKLAPFGVCKTVEVRSAGGERKASGFHVAHFRLEYDKMVQTGAKSDQEPYHPIPLSDDGTWSASPGTTIMLKDFYPKRVPDRETFARQLSYRFGIGRPDFSIVVKDTKEHPEPEFRISKKNIPLMEGTQVELSDRPVISDTGVKLPVTGWVGMAKVSYANEEFAGIRIYVRGKVASITRDFGLPAGFTGEFVARSYLVGEIHADWLDEREDLIQTHRQEILWSSELGQAFAKWGQEIIREVARKGREPKRKRVSETFLQKSRLEEKARERYDDPALIKTTLDLGERIGKIASEEDVEDVEYVEDLAEIILSVAPHKLLVDVFKRIQEIAIDGNVDLKELMKLFQTANIAQLASFGQIVIEKLKVIDIFENSIRPANKVDERDLQGLLERAPWLIDPRWEPMTANMQFKTFRRAFEAWYERRFHQKVVTSSIPHNDEKRPDFILLHIGSHIRLVEIKPPGHAFADEDWVRLNRYDDAMKEFFQAHPTYVESFPGKFTITLIADLVQFANSSNEKAYNLLKREGTVVPKTWEDLFNETTQFHKTFLNARESLQN